MAYGIYLSAEGASVQATRMEIIAHNLANVDTVAFKRELAVFQAAYAEAVEQGLEAPGSGSVNDVGGGVMLLQTKTDFSPGPLKRTQIPTDVALTGDGFFVVQKGDQQFLTRAGNFRLTERGELVTQQGYAVMGEGGTPIAIEARNGPFEVTPEGAIRQAGTAQNLAIVSPASPGELVRVGENLFQSKTEPQPVPPAARSLKPGYLEASGVRPTSEMVQLIEASRAIEANINMMQTQDQMLSGLVNRVMRVA